MSGISPLVLSGLGDVGQAAVNYQGMVKGMWKLKDLEAHAEVDAINIERYLRDLSKVCWDMFRATGAMSEQEHLRLISMITAAGQNGGGKGGTHGYSKGIMEHKVVQNLRAVKGDNSLSRQWHQKFTAAL